MRIVTFNLRCPWDGDGVNSFIHRAGMIYEKIRAERPDVIAFQEVTPKNFDFLYNSLSDIYDVQVRYRSENYDGEGLAIALLRSSVELLHCKSFWLSPTPDVPGSRFENQSHCPRITVFTIVREKLSGRKLRICNVHLDHRSDEARILGARLLLSALEKERADIETVILGDMNAAPASCTIAEFRDSSLRLTDLTDGIDVSFHDYGRKAGKIDYVFATEELARDFESARIWDNVHSGIYLSDHYPIEVSLK